MPNLPMSIEELGAYVNQVAQNADDVIITRHCELRMDERNITRREAWTTLRRGCVCSDPTFNTDHGTWDFKFQEPPPRDVVCVVVAAKLDPTTNTIIAITVYEV